MKEQAIRILILVQQREVLAYFSVGKIHQTNLMVFPQKASYRMLEQGWRIRLTLKREVSNLCYLLKTVFHTVPSRCTMPAAASCHRMAAKGRHFQLDKLLTLKLLQKQDFQENLLMGIIISLDDFWERTMKTMQVYFIRWLITLVYITSNFN